MSQYQQNIRAIEALKAQHGSTWRGINAESSARMRAQNRFKDGIAIAKYTAEF